MSSCYRCLLCWTFLRPCLFIAAPSDWRIQFSPSSRSPPPLALSLPSSLAKASQDALHNNVTRSLARGRQQHLHEGLDGRACLAHRTNQSQCFNLAPAARSHQDPDNGVSRGMTAGYWRCHEKGQRALVVSLMGGSSTCGRINSIAIPNARPERFARYKEAWTEVTSKALALPSVAPLLLVLAPASWLPVPSRSSTIDSTRKQAHTIQPHPATASLAPTFGASTSVTSV